MLLSGGVDSSVALHLLRERRPKELRAFYLKIWLQEELEDLGDCPWQEDLHYARQVCEMAGVPLEVVPLQREYEQHVVSYTVAELRAGRTPSADLLCNERIKFGAFFDAIDTNFKRVASGHYAQTSTKEGLCQLSRSPDPVKDQTYFLSRLSQQQLARCWFPLGHLTKAQVRNEAEERGLPNRNRPDSQGICFLGKIPFDQFIRHHLGELPGVIREGNSGKVLGEHRGYWFHTIGQRKGLGLSGGPWFVVGKDVEKNEILVTHKRELEVESRSTFAVEELHWIAAPPKQQDLEVKLRHGPNLLPCQLTTDGGEGEVELSRPDSGIAPGQFAVFYHQETCLGSGVISR